MSEQEKETVGLGSDRNLPWWMDLIPMPGGASIVDGEQVLVHPESGQKYSLKKLEE